ncbi:15595_t:CDS:2, partial [Dentiscutata heterogama]
SRDILNTTLTNECYDNNYYLLRFLIINGVNVFIPPPKAELTTVFINNVLILFIINNLESMPWFNLTPTTDLPSRTGLTTCAYGEDKNRIDYIGSRLIVGERYTTVYDIATQRWNTPKKSENFTTNRWFLQRVVSGNDTYVYGRNIGQTNMLTWTEIPSGILAPVGVQGYTAMLLNNKSILYIGGQQGNISSSKYDHGAVYTQDNQVFLCAFFLKNGNAEKGDNNYEWVTSYVPNKKFLSTSTSMPSPSVTSFNVGAIIGIAFGAISGLIILITIAVLIVKRYDHPLYYSDPQKSSDKPNNEVIG